MDDNLDRRTKYNLIGYLKSKVEGKCDSMLIQDASKSQERSVHPMVEFLLYSTMACTDADALILRIRKHENLKPEWKLELVETIKESVPECRFYWDAND